MPRTLLASLIAMALLPACNSPQAGAGPTTPSVSTPAFQVKLEPVVGDLESPWGLVFLPQGGMLITLKEQGLAYMASPDAAPVMLAGVPAAYTDNQGGYLGLALDPDFATNRRLYMAFSEGVKDANHTAVLRARLSEDRTTLEDTSVIFRATDRATPYHFGSRLDFLPDGTLLVTLGDGFRYKDKAQETDSYFGKIVRINTDGSVPADNPFANGPAPAIWSYGHRNVQGLVVDDATGRVWAHEHGPKGGDELNLILAGHNYGWPVITYGINYDGTIITTETAREGMDQPLVKWVPSIAPSGMALYTGERYPGWQGDLFIGGMEGPAGLKLVRVDLDADGRVLGTEDLLTADGLPIRDVVQGPDGWLYVLTKQLDGGLYRVALTP